MDATTIILSGPGKNSLSTALMQRALEQVRAAKDAPIFLTGDGDAFSAGLNLKEVSTLDVAGMTTFLTALEELVKALYEHPAPVVAWVNGHAIAGGCVLALCCDVRVMTAREDARIGLNEVALGLRFPPLTFAMARARLTAPNLERVLLESALYPASEARHLGLVDVIGEEAQARAILATMASHPRDIYAATKLLLRPRLDVSDADRRRFADDTIPYWASPERRAAMLAVLEKRKA
ncbi:MAG: enoyl-CoA hydratase/isomerase family protein [Labilithrix sp.]|nr:enoyl-CoA hydratase/isomerase family protein [Labilithrix sp.]MCW5815696.1 enoyl-CoA hydratase/isomerase family protein [Labilithrix sp.]